jgi:hypothetical protein
MNAPRFEVYPRREDVTRPGEHEPIGGSVDFGWRFRDANGRITFIGGEGFTRREDAKRAVKGALHDVAALLGVSEGDLPVKMGDIPIVDVDD